MKKLIVSVETIDQGKVKFNVHQIDRIYTNEVTLKFRYLDWLKDGKFEIKKYQLTPESLKELIDIVIKYNLEKKLSIGSSLQFIKAFPTTESLLKRKEMLEKLPKDFEK